MRPTQKYTSLQVIVVHRKELDSKLLVRVIEKVMNLEKVSTEILIVQNMETVSLSLRNSDETLSVILSEYDHSTGTIVDSSVQKIIKELTSLSHVQMHVLTTWPDLKTIQETLGSSAASVNDRSKLNDVLQGIIKSLKQ